MKLGNRLLVSSCLFLSLAFLLSGCGQPQVSLKQPETVYQTPGPSYIPVEYLIGAGDQLEVLYHIDPGFARADYFIDTEDKLRVEFYYYPIMSRQVRVRPDGHITLPRVGDVKVQGQRPMAVAAGLAKLYSPYLRRPSITVEVVGFDAKIEQLKQSIMTQERGQSRLVVVRPDGKISLPLVQDVVSAGLTATDLACLIEQKYLKYVESLSVSVAVLRAESNRIYVMGEVGKPNYYRLIGPTTLSQTIAMAGGLGNGANSQQVVVISRGPNGKPLGRLIDMDTTVGMGNVGNDIMIKQYDVIYVPPTKLAQGRIIGEQLWTLIPLRFVLNGTYSFGGVAAK